MLDFLKTINHDYSGVLSLLSSIIMVTVTIIYVVQTKRQANYAKQSANLLAEQIKIDKQPCVIPEIIDSHGIAFDATNYTRIQLDFEINLKNVGDSPAINIYSLADFELQFTMDKHGNKKMVSAALVPVFVQALSSNEERKIHIHFETAEIKSLIKELTKSHEMNLQRIREDPTHNAYHGAKIIIRVYYKNIMGQWCESKLSQVISWLEYIDSKERKTNNINENTIPPKQIRLGDRFTAVIISKNYVPFSFRMTTDDYVKAILEQYIDESPWLMDSLGITQ